MRSSGRERTAESPRSFCRARVRSRGGAFCGTGGTMLMRLAQMEGGGEMASGLIGEKGYERRADAPPARRPRFGMGDVAFKPGDLGSDRDYKARDSIDWKRIVT